MIRRHTKLADIDEAGLLAAAPAAGAPGQPSTPDVPSAKTRSAPLGIGHQEFNFTHNLASSWHSGEPSRRPECVPVLCWPLMLSTSHMCRHDSAKNVQGSSLTLVGTQMLPRDPTIES